MTFQQRPNRPSDCSSLVPQFVVHVYPSQKGYRVVGGGLVHFDVERPEEVEPGAREAILNILRAAFPDRSGAPADPTAERALWFEIELRRVDPVSVPPPKTTEEAPFDAQDRSVRAKRPTDGRTGMGVQGSSGASAVAREE